MSKKLIIFIIAFLYIGCLKKEPIDIKITQIIDNKDIIGKIGTVVLSCSYDSRVFNIIDTEKKPYFFPKIIDGQNSYDVNCGLWKPKEGNLYIFCNIEETVPAGEYEISFNETQSFEYKEYIINLEEPDQAIKFKKINEDIIDIYSGDQTINIEEGKDSYELRFNIVSYNGEKLILNYVTQLDCFQENNILRCPITKTSFEEFLQNNVTKGYITYSDNNGVIDDFPLVAKVEIIYNKAQKENVIVNIKKLLTNTVEKEMYAAYETDVTYISNILLGGEFRLPFINENNKEKRAICSFRKYDQKPLYLICYIKDEGTYHLKEITEEEEYNEVNIKYNFKIQPVKNEEKVEYKDAGTFIYYLYPDVFNFTGRDNFTILYYPGIKDNLKGITFNEDKEDLKCENFGTVYKKCEVPKSHFIGKKSGYYFTKCTNHNGGKTIFYEIPPVKVILSPDDETQQGNHISLSLFYSLLLILILV